MSSTDNRTSLDSLSIDLLNYQYPAFILWLLLGVVSIVNNALIIATVLKTKTLHTNSMWTLASLAMSESLDAVGFELQAVRKLHLYINQHPETSTRVECLGWSIVIIWFSHISDSITVVLNLDRFLALAMPIFYRTRLGNTYVLAVNLACWILHTIFYMIAFKLEEPGKLMAACYANQSPDKWFSTFSVNTRWVLLGTSTALYLCTLIRLRMRFNQTKMLTQKERIAARRDMELSMIKTLGVLLCSYIGFKLVGYGITTYGVAAGGNTGLYLAGFAGLPQLAYTATHFPVYMCMCKSFRDGFVQNVWRKLGQQQNSVGILHS